MEHLGHSEKNKMTKQMRIATAALVFFIASPCCESVYKAILMHEARSMGLTSPAQAQPVPAQAQPQPSPELLLWIWSWTQNASGTSVTMSSG